MLWSCCPLLALYWLVIWLIDRGRWRVQQEGLSPGVGQQYPGSMFGVSLNPSDPLSMSYCVFCWHLPKTCVMACKSVSECISCPIHNAVLSPRLFNQFTVMPWNDPISFVLNSCNPCSLHGIFYIDLRGVAQGSAVQDKKSGSPTRSPLKMCSIKLAALNPMIFFGWGPWLDPAFL